MKRYTILIALFFVFRQGANAQAFLIANPSGNNDATEISCDYYQLTPNSTFEQGAIWYSQQLNLNNAFDYTFDIFLGTNNGVGADGMAFVIQNQGQGLGPQGTFGSQLGYGTIPGKSLAVEFDTHNNGAGAPYGDIAQHHIAIDTGGIQFPPAAGPVPALASGGNIDDGNWHTAEIIWAPGTQTMTINFDGVQRLSCTFTAGLLSSVFNNQNLLYWGWTGASGSKFNTQQIRVPLQANFVAANNYAQCGLNNVVFTDSSVSGLNNLTWFWNFADGTSATTQDVSHNYTTSGSYNVKLTVTDGGGCTSDTVIPVNVYALPVITPTQTNVTCFGDANGTAKAVVTGGTPNYTYTWVPAVSTVSTAAGLAPGTYGLIVTDHNGCADTTAYIITQPPVLTNSFVQVNVLCHGDSTGSLTAAPVGGTPGYTYNWGPNVSNDSVATHLAGNTTYNLTVTDANGCTVSNSATITQPPLLTAGLTTGNVGCYGASTGYVVITAAGGTPAYSYAWNPNVTATDSAMNTPAGNYSVTLTDANGCSLIEDTIITQPAQALSLSATAVPVLCFGYATGVIDASANGGTPTYTFLIAPGGAPPQVSSDSAVFRNLLPNTYNVKVTDQNTCTFDTTVTVNQPPQLLVDSMPAVAPKCYGYQDGQILVVAGGGTPGYNYQFSNGITDSSGMDNNLAAGTYAVTVTDHSGCTATDSATLTQPDSVLVEVTPTPVQVILGNQLQLGATTNQNGTITYSWSPDFGLSCYDCADPVFNGVFSQPYTVIATNQNGCAGNFAFTVTVVPEYNVFFPNAFLPAGSGANSAWQVFGKKDAIIEFSVSVFDRLGEKVFESNSVDFQWDGTFKGKPAPMGVYTYESRIVWLNDYTSKLFEGTITLIR